MVNPSKSRPIRIIGVIGGSTASEREAELAFGVGQEIAKHGWMLVTGGLGGVMHHASHGAISEGGGVIGILPTPNRTGMNPYVTIPIVTNMGHARNVIIAHTADLLIAIGGSEGTLSEIAIGLKLGKTVVSLESWFCHPRIVRAESVKEAIHIAADELA